jgi:3'(2'), 5'-bisphosphate nucleotidase/inositol polyphosphate 1-phosphatase
VVLGVLGCPNLPLAPITDQDCDEGQAARSFSDEAVGTMFAASKGQGAYAGPVLGGMPTQRIFCDDAIPPPQARYMESFEARHSNHDLALQIAAEIGVELPSLRLDSQAKYGALSRGDASIFMRFPDASYREKIWDHCAGVSIIQESGAVISDALGRPLDFSRGRFFPDLNGGIVAATPSMHRAIIAAIRKIRGLPQAQN